MSLEKHSLLKDLPEHHHTIRHLKMHNAHFGKLFDSYHELDTQVYKIEQDNTPVADDYIESLKKQRVQLKDELVGMIQKTEQTI